MDTPYIRLLLLLFPCNDNTPLYLLLMSKKSFSSFEHKLITQDGRVPVVKLKTNAV